MDAKEYLERSGLKELNDQGLDAIAASRELEKAFLDTDNVEKNRIYESLEKAGLVVPTSLPEVRLCIAKYGNRY